MPSLTFEELRVTTVVYTSAIVPLILIPLLMRKQRVPAWVPYVYLGSFAVCALGWELWFTYGWVAGDPVDLRRSANLTAMIPLHVNWLLNSLADGGTICMGGLWLVWRTNGRSQADFYRWSWRAFAVLFAFFLSQNIFVEMFLYHDQLAVGKPISWAPLAPTGPWLNPTLFEFNDRTITLQGQVPWIIMTPLFYGALIYCLNRYWPRSDSE
ncbi:MAG: hypothetical protein GY733_23510 [bacterium]|nr:hypothetical protein [bacterium]